MPCSCCPVPASLCVLRVGSDASARLAGAAAGCNGHKQLREGRCVRAARPWHSLGQLCVGHKPTDCTSLAQTLSWQSWHLPLRWLGCGSPGGDFPGSLACFRLWAQCLSLPTECSPGWYGRDCQRPCQCRNGGLCDPATGTCHCPAGYIGADCSVGECWGAQELLAVPSEGSGGEMSPAHRWAAELGAVTVSTSCTGLAAANLLGSLPSLHCQPCPPCGSLQLSSFAVPLHRANICLCCLLHAKKVPGCEGSATSALGTCRKAKDRLVGRGCCARAGGDGLNSDWGEGRHF